MTEQAASKPYTASDFKLLNASPDAVAKLNEALAYLNNSETARSVLGKMIESGTTIRMVSKLDGDTFHPEASQEREGNTPVMARTAGDKNSFPANTVDWNPDALLLYTDAQHSNPITEMNFSRRDEKMRELGYLSPALLLIHEAGHAVDKKYGKHAPDKADALYENGNERYSGMEVENKVAKELGEGVRENHGGKYVTLPPGASPSLHTMSDDSSKLLKWSAKYLDGALEVMGGSFIKNPLNPKTRDGNIPNTPPDLGTFDSQNNIFTLNNSDLRIDPARHPVDGLTIRGKGNLEVLGDVSVHTRGDFTVRAGGQQHHVSEPALLEIKNGQLHITPEQPSPEKATQPLSTTETGRHQLADLFKQTIATLPGDAPQVATLAERHPDLLGRLTFYYGMKDRVPEITAKRIGDNLDAAIRLGEPLPAFQITVPSHEASQEYTMA